MSADNYYRICRHPNGGYAAVMGYMSNLEDGFQVEPSEADPQFNDWSEAYAFADRDSVIEYGIHIDPDVINEDRVRVLTRTYPEEVAHILRDMGYSVEAPSEVMH